MPDLSPDQQAPDLEAIRGRLERATPGPWHWYSPADDGQRLQTSRGNDEPCDYYCIPASGGRRTNRPHAHFVPDAVILSSWGDHGAGSSVEVTEPDADLIAHAPADISALLAHIDRQQAEIDGLREQVERYRDLIDALVFPDGPPPLRSEKIG